MVALLLSSCSRMIFSNCDWDDSSLVLMRRDTFASCNVQEATLLLWQWEFFSCNMMGPSLLVAGGFCLIVMCGYAPL